MILCIYHNLYVKNCDIVGWNRPSIGPLPTTNSGNKYILTMIDYFSKWPEAAPLPDKSAKGIAALLYQTWYVWPHN